MQERVSKPYCNEAAFSARAEKIASILFEPRRKLRLSDIILRKITLACKMPLCGNKA